MPWPRVLRPILTAQLSVAASMLLGDTACQYIAKGRNPVVSAVSDATPSSHTTHLITPLIATTATDDTNELTLTTPPPPTHPQLTPVSTLQPPHLTTPDDPTSTSPLPDVRHLSAHLPHWLDPQRSLVMLCTGLFVSGPWSAFTFTGTEWLFPGRSTRAIASKVLLNGFTAPIGISLMFATVKLLEGATLTDAAAKVQQSVFRTWVTGAAYWPFVSVLNFRFVPFEWRPLFSGLAGAAWQTYMSAQAHKPVEVEGEGSEGSEVAAGAVVERSMPLSTGAAGIEVVKDNNK